MLSYNDALAEVMWFLITDPRFGYSQYERAGDGTVVTTYLSDETLVSVPGGDKDCSEAIRVCLAALGLVAWNYNDSYTWTGNEPGVLSGAGFVTIDPNDADVGDVLLRDGHTEMVVGGWNGELYQAGFRISELGTIYGEAGDQTGWESTYSDYHPWEWDTCWRYVGPERGGSTTPSKDEIEEDKMVCLIQPDGQGRLVYYDGTNVHALHHEHEAEAIRMVYRSTHGGREIPTIQLGSPEAPWAHRFMNAVQRGEEMWSSMV